MLHLLLAAAVPAALPSTGPTDDNTAPVRLWINDNGRYRPGEAVRVQVETGTTGYLLVFQYDPDGNVRVLFPLSPSDDAFVEANRRYEVREYDHSQSFVADGSGPGLIYAAIGAEPWRFEGFATASGWDYGAIIVPRDSRDPEADLTALAQRMSGPSGFDYDVEDYLVVPPASRVYDGPPPPSWWSPLYYDDFYYDDYWYDGYYPYYSCYGCRYRSGFFVHVGFGTPFWYYPSYWYRPWYYHYYRLGGFYTPYWGNRGYYSFRPVAVVPRTNVPTIVGRPRGYDIERRNPFGTRARGSDPGLERDRPGSVSGSPASDARPPARRARGQRPSAERPAAQRPASAARPSGGNDRPAASGGARGSDRSRARGGRSRGNGNEVTASARTPEVHIERSRPESNDPRREWVRIDDGPEGRRVGEPEGRRGIEPAGQRARATVPRSRPVEPARTESAGQRVRETASRARPVERAEARRGEPRTSTSGWQRVSEGASRRSDESVGRARSTARPSARSVERPSIDRGARASSQPRAGVRPSSPAPSARAQPRPASQGSGPKVSRSGGGSSSRGSARAGGRPRSRGN